MAPRVVHGTLTADAMTTVSLAVDAALVEILNRDGAAEIFFTIDGDDPTVEGEDCQVLPAAVGAIELTSPDQSATHVKLISTGTPKFSVRKVR